jgi:hypothetical protein
MTPWQPMTPFEHDAKLDDFELDDEFDDEPDDEDDDESDDDEDGDEEDSDEEEPETWQVRAELPGSR